MLEPQNPKKPNPQARPKAIRCSWQRPRDQRCDKTNAPTGLVGEPTGSAKPEKADETPEHVESAVLRRRPKLFRREVERQPSADRAIDAAAAAGDEGPDQRCRQHVRQEDVADADLVGLGIPGPALGTQRASAASMSTIRLILSWERTQ